MQVPACLAVLSAPFFSVPEDATTNLLMVLRWFHIMAGITWIGLLYFFNLVSIPFLRELEPGIRSQVMPKLMSRALWWYRWASVVTVFVGIWYWMKIVGGDARIAQVAPGTAIWSFFVLWTVAFLVYMGILMSPAGALHKGPALAIITIVLVIAASYGYVLMNSHGWESNRLLCIGIGGGIGWFMMFNVWGLSWRMQKRLILWTGRNASEGTPLPEKAEKYAHLSILSMQTNFWLSFPMLFFMAAASHYPLFVRA